MNWSQLTTPILLVAVVAFALYRRVRRSVGRQPLRQRVMMFRLILLSGVSALLLFSPLMTSSGLEYCAAGAVIGAGLAAYSLRHTKFETTSSGQFYTPHLYAGLVVIALLVGRVIYRVVRSYAATPAAEQSLSTNHSPALFSSPLTFGLLFMTTGYYICYLTGIIVIAHRLKPISSGASTDRAI